jgi:ketosteroid isomerase-like protein
MMRTRAGLALAAIAAIFALGVVGMARAADSAKDQVSTAEHGLIAATSADEASKYLDATDADVYDFNGPLEYKGTPAVQEDFTNAFAAGSNFKGEFLELQIYTSGKLGVARSIQHFTWTGKDGKPGEATFRVTDVWLKEKSGWKLIHSHVSVPVDAKGMGEMNLKPAGS